MTAATVKGPINPNIDNILAGNSIKCCPVSTAPNQHIQVQAKVMIKYHYGATLRRLLLFISTPPFQIKVFKMHPPVPFQLFS